MAHIVPYIRLLDDIPSTIWDQDFGLGLLQDDLIRPSAIASLARSPYYIRPWRHLRGSESGVSNIVNDSNGFKVSMDVQQFKPEQINVKVVDGFVVVEGKHEERQDEHGYISRQFQRRYKLPKDVDPKTVQSTLSSDGVLTVAAPKAQPLAANEQRVPIVQTNQPAIKTEEKKAASGDKKEA